MYLKKESERMLQSRWKISAGSFSVISWIMWITNTSSACRRSSGRRICIPYITTGACPTKAGRSSAGLWKKIWQERPTGSRTPSVRTPVSIISSLTSTGRQVRKIQGILSLSCGWNMRTTARSSGNILNTRSGTASASCFLKCSIPVTMNSRPMTWIR